MAVKPGPPSSLTDARRLLQRASEMLRIDYHQSGIAGSHKLVTIADAYGIQCEMRGGGWASSQILDSSIAEHWESDCTRAQLPLQCGASALHSAEEKKTCVTRTP